MNEWIAPKQLPRATWLERLQEWWSLLRIILTPSGTRSDLTYDVLAQRHVMGDDTLFINLGYWDNASTLDQASIHMAEFVAEKADLQPEDRILDVGFGFADQNIHWCQTRALQDLHGINISPVQVAFAQQRVQQAGLSHCIHLEQGDATSIKKADNSFDKVVGLECAFHFCTRQDFIAEALRVLKPDGLLTLADFIARPNTPANIWQRIASFLGRRSWQIPHYNLYSQQHYQQLLENAGFRDIQIENINAHVFAHFVGYQRKRFDTDNFRQRYHPLIRFIAKKQIDWGFLDTLDYIVVTARK